jgi:8-oxo-dGTP pyrophosphatase MutT (NUDIX family)
MESYIKSVNFDSSKNKIKKKDFYCGNCGKHGHIYRNCDEPITSFGVMYVMIDYENNKIIEQLIYNLKINDDCIKNYNGKQFTINTEGIKFENQLDIQTFCIFRDRIKFLMIRRKNTLGYIEFIRGRYHIDNIDGINFLFKQMTANEIKKIGKNSFDELWEEMWLNNKYKNTHQNEYITSKKMFEKLKYDPDSFINLDFFVENVIPTWEHAEWGFPKGRRNYQESDFECAIREFKEESGYNEDEIIILDKIKPINEKLIGTNGISYKHIYYPAITTTTKKPTIDPLNKYQIDEIGDIGWFTYNEAMKLIRPYHTERKKILTELYMYLINNLVNVFSEIV